MGLLGKVKQAKGFVKGLSSVSEANPLRFTITTMIENGKDSPDRNKMYETVVQTQNDYARGLIFECLDEYLNYQGSDSQILVKTLDVCYWVVASGSESAVEGMRDRIPKFKSFSTSSNEKIKTAALKIIDVLEDEKSLKELREKYSLEKMGASGIIMGGGQVNIIGLK